ncbi:MAG: helix-turn-helix domain-containing protein [archaeon]
MDLKKIENTLREIGLTEYESRVYAALLNLGTASSGQILEESSLRTGKIYDILNSLKKKGFVSEVVVNGVKKYSAAPPERMLDYLKVKENKIKEEQSNVQAILPSIMEKINSKKEGIKVEVYTGFEGLKSAFAKEIERYSKGAEIAVLGVQPKSSYNKRINDFFEYTVYPARKRQKVLTRKIKDTSSRHSVSSNKYPKKIRYLDYQSLTIVEVCKDLTMIESYLENPIILVIESQEVADSFLKQFNMLWKTAKG